MASIAGSIASAGRNRLAAEPSPPRPRAERTEARIGQPPREPAARLCGIDRAGAPLARGSGFVIHQLLAAMPELRGPPPDLPRTIGAYRTHLAQRIHYSGPARPVDLRV